MADDGLMQIFVASIDVAAYALEGVGVAVIIVGFVLATVSFLRQRQPLTSHAAYIDYRHRMGRSTLLGLDFLIAGDIIKTIIVADAMSSVAVLGLIVLIRTFLSMTLHVEVEGCWPWQHARTKAAAED
jgi:uncharacterized membrane protein